MTMNGSGNASRLRIPRWLRMLLVAAIVILAGWGTLHAIGAVVCSSYNFISNDLCDRWRFDPPAEEALPLPEGWRVVWTRLDCGSGGCPTRVTILEPPGDLRDDPVLRYVTELRSQGWPLRQSDSTTPSTFRASRGKLSIAIQSAVAEDLAPDRVATNEHVRVALLLKE